MAGLTSTRAGATSNGESVSGSISSLRHQSLSSASPSSVVEGPFTGRRRSLDVALVTRVRAASAAVTLGMRHVRTKSLEKVQAALHLMRPACLGGRDDVSQNIDTTVRAQAMPDLFLASRLVTCLMHRDHLSDAPLREIKSVACTTTLGPWRQCSCSPRPTGAASAQAQLKIMPAATAPTCATATALSGPIGVSVQKHSAHQVRTAQQDVAGGTPHTSRSGGTPPPKLFEAAFQSPYFFRYDILTQCPVSADDRH